MEPWQIKISKAFEKGKTIQTLKSSKFFGLIKVWQDFVPQNQLDRPNLDFKDKNYWRIKP